MCYLCTEWRDEQTVVARFILHRVSPALFCTSFTVVLFYWYCGQAPIPLWCLTALARIEIYHQSYLKHRTRSDILSQKRFLIFFLFNCVIWLKAREARSAPMQTH